jgi:hypothetical protein
VPDVSGPPVDPTRCPLCGADNSCGIAAGSTTCWCFDTPIPAEVIEQLPADRQGTVCVCPRCAALRPAPANAIDQNER